MEGHRLTQAIEMMEFIRISAASADAIFIGGDLNLEPYTTALRLMKRSLGLKDAWLDQVVQIAFFFLFNLLRQKLYVFPWMKYKQISVSIS